MPTDAECAYAAGLFDGEGHIAIVHSKGSGNLKSKNRYERYFLKLTLSLIRKPAIDWLQSRFGGAVRFCRGKRSYDTGTYERWDWTLSTKEAELFLRAIQPYAQIKTTEIQVALKFRSLVLPPTGRSKVPPDVVELRRQCFHEIRRVRAEERGAFYA